MVASGAAWDDSRVDGMDRLTTQQLESNRKAVAVNAVAKSIAIQATNKVATDSILAMLLEQSLATEHQSSGVGDGSVVVL